MAQLDAQFHPQHSGTGFELGWDHAHHGVTPSVDHLYGGSPLRQGWEAGKAKFGGRTMPSSAQVRQWLSLRTHAWSRGRSFDGVQVTPNYLQQIDTDWCPIVRCALPRGAGSIDRVRHDAGYAAGNLVIMSNTANQAKGSHDFASASAVAQSVAQGPFTVIGYLGAVEWQRVATLCSFVTELPHEQAATLPLLLLPPNRLRLFNPIQALQAMVTRQLDTPNWSPRLARIQKLLPSHLAREFNSFVLALVARVLEVGKLEQAQQIRWALEDAWADVRVQRHWSRLALQLSAEQAESIVQRASQKRLATVLVQQHAPDTATDGWAIERQGYASAGLLRHQPTLGVLATRQGMLNFESACA